MSEPNAAPPGKNAAPRENDVRKVSPSRTGRFAISLLAAIAFACGIAALLPSANMRDGQSPSPRTTSPPRTSVVVDPARAAARNADRRAFAMPRARNISLARLGAPLPGTPDLDKLDERLAAHGVKRGAAVLIRIFKREHELELWLARDGRFHRFATYPICIFSGGLGPKFQTGDRQAPEGFYTVGGQQMNPNSRWYKSFNLGFPNAFDESQGRTGSALMVHGGCSSAGCYAMTNAVIGEIWQLTTAALERGQSKFQVQAFPFRMTDAAMAVATDHPDAAFWRNLKRGYDAFEQTQLPPSVSVCAGAYRFEAGRGRPELTPVIKAGCGERRGLAGIGRRAETR